MSVSWINIGILFAAVILLNIVLFREAFVDTTGTSTVANILSFNPDTLSLTSGSTCVGSNVVDPSGNAVKDPSGVPVKCPSATVSCPAVNDLSQQGRDALVQQLNMTFKKEIADAIQQAKRDALTQIPGLIASNVPPPPAPACPAPLPDCKDTDTSRCQRKDPSKLPPYDLSEYIRKDSIPCWGCSLDY